MAGEVRLDLQVGLDTAYLRNQLSTIGTKLGGQSITLPVTFNRQDISTKTKALQRYIGNKTFDIKIESNTLQALTDKVQNFQRRLQELKSEKITLDIAVGGFASIGDREAEKVQRDLRDAVLGGQKKIFIPTSIRPSIPRQHVRDFTNAVKSKLAGITVDVKINPLGAKEAAAQASTPAAATQGGFSQYRLRKLGQDIKPLYQAAARAGLVEFDETIANDVRAIAKSLSQVGKDVVAGLLNGLSSGNPQLQQAARSLGETLIKTMKTVLGIASPSREFKKIGENVGEGFQIGAVQSLDKAFDALERKLEERLRRLQALTQGGPSRRGAFPFVAKTGPIEGRALASESMRLAAEIDVAYQQLAQVRQQRQTSRESSLAFQRSALGQQAGRLLPAGISPLATTGPTAQEQVVRQFYASLQATEQTLRRYFSANSYLPKATRDLTRAMQVAQASIKMLPSAMTPAIAGLLPAAGQSGALYAAVRKGIERKLDQQMRGLMLPAAGDISSRQFRDAAAKAAQIDAANQARYQARQARIQARQSLIATRSAMSRLALPAAGETGAVAAARTTLSGQQFRAPSLGRTAAGQPGAAMDQSGPIADRLRQAAVNFSKNAPAVIKYLNLFSTAGGINISDLPGPGESPGQYIRRIQQSLRLQLKQGGFGAGTVPSRTEFFQPGGGPQLPGMPLQPRLPPAGGTGGSDRVRGVGQPPEPGGALVRQPARGVPKEYFAIGKAIKGLEPVLQKARVPLAGAIQNLAGEFGNAVQQVLLFGTAYKALAFLTSIPGQALKASTSLQSFNNQLLAITGTASEVARSTQFINDTVARFNVPLESAREGFVRLYASMAPAGMEPGTIENLFTGISQASATLGLSADQVDRVTYAFSQMASKGKVMSEEVTGQLGDVIPGALSLMADAAGLSMAEFKKAMEDGLVSGDAMKQLFTNLPIVLEQRFGKGAVGAAKTLQGQLNNLSTATKRFYESFDPIVSSVAKVVLPLLSAGLKDAQSAIAALGLSIQGINPATNLLSKNAKLIYDNLNILINTAKSLGAAIQSLGGVFSVFGTSLSLTLQLFNAIVGNPIGQFFVKLAVYTGLATAAINLLAKQALINAIVQLGMMIRNINFTVASLKLLIATSRMAKIAIGGLVAGGILVGLEMLTSHIAKAREETEKLRKSAVLATDALKQMSYSQMITEERNIKKRIENIDKLQKAAKGALRIGTPTKEQERIAAEEGLSITGRAGRRGIDLTRAEGVRQQLSQSLRDVQTEMETRDRSAASTAVIQPIDLSGAAPGTTAKTGAKERESRVPLLELQLATTKQLFELERQMMTARLGGNELEVIRLQGLKEQLKINEAIAEVRLNSQIPANEKSLQIQKLLKDAELARLQTSFDLEQKISETLAKTEERVNSIRQSALDELNDKKAYERLLAEGVAPAIARITVEVDRQFATESEALRLLQERITKQIALLEAEKEATENQARRLEIEQQLAVLRGQSGTVAGTIAGLPGVQAQTLEARISTQGTEAPADPMADAMRQAEENMKKLSDVRYQVAEGAKAIGDAFGQAFRDIASGSMSAQEALANMMQSIGSHFLEMAAQIIAQQTVMIILGTIMKALGVTLPGGSSGGGDLGSSFTGNFDLSGTSFATMPKSFGFSALANGGIAPGGFKAFANGGIATSPTLGLIGEGRYNEAIVPLPDGKSIPVMMRGEQPSSRDLIGGGSMNQAMAPILNMSFESTTINGVEYVSRDQLEQAMMDTRKAAAREGATRGATLAIDKLQQSPSTRRRIGLS